LLKKLNSGHVMMNMKAICPISKVYWSNLKIKRT